MSLTDLRVTPIVAYQAVTAVAASMTVAVLVATGARLGNIWAVCGLCLAAGVAERARVRLGPNSEASISLVPTVFAAVVFGPAAAALVGAASFVGDFRRPYLKWGIYTSTRALTGALAGLAALTSGAIGSDIGAVVVATAVASIFAEATDVGFATYTLHLRGGDAGGALRHAGPAIIASIPLYAPVVAILAVAYSAVSPWTLALFFVPALAAQRLFSLYQQQRELAESLSEANAQLERANLSFATALVATLDARDRYTAGHSAAVAIYARDIAARMGLVAEQQRLAHVCGLVHDIGKIGLPPGLLEKPGALTLDERRQMERHPEIAERILAKVDDYAEIAAIVRHHHERVDGYGYPDGLAGDAVPQLSRILAVADAYNAMTSDRPYRDAMPSRVARLRIAQAVETQFDTSVVAAFEAILASASEDYRSGVRADFHLASQEAEATDAAFKIEPVEARRSAVSA